MVDSLMYKGHDGLILAVMLRYLYLMQHVLRSNLRRGNFLMTPHSITSVYELISPSLAEPSVPVSTL